MSGIRQGGADVKDIIFDYMACGDVIRRYKRRKINIISIVVMGAGIIMLHLADVIDGSELELHLLIRDYYIPAVIIGAGLYIIARITHITGEADAIVIAYITVLTGMYITIQTVLLSMFLIIIAGGTLIAGGRMKLRTSMPYIPFCWCH